MCQAILQDVATSLLYGLHFTFIWKQISFQEFKNKLLEPGVVERIEITNKSVAKVYVYTGEYEINTFHVVAQLPDSICNVLMSYFAIH